jgi:signal transduction histidine kinase
MPALLLFPLESQGTVLGFLTFQRSQSHVWQPEEIELVKLVSAQVSTAIIQTETLRQVQALVEKRTAELQQSLSIQAKLYERTRQQLDQLRRLNQLKDEFLSTVSHELRTPLTSMTMAIRMLRQIGLSSDRSSRYLDILEQQCAQETNLINDLLTLQELESKQVSIQLEEIYLKEMILDLEKSFNQKWAAKGLRLALTLPEKPIKLHSDRDSLNRILVELLTNAGKYSNPSTLIYLSITLQYDNPTNKVILKLTNTGPGIPSTELPFIFDKFRRCQRAGQNATQGTGLGLALVKSLVQLINGTISVSSCLADEIQSCDTSFTLTLPQSLDLSGS